MIESIVPDENPLFSLVKDTLKKQKQALVFVNTRNSAEKQAEDISKEIADTNKDLENLSEKILNVLSKPTKQCTRLSKCVKKGIAFHHSGLAPQQKHIIEDNFKKGMIKIICCTPTLAAGLDLPAFRTILKDLKRYTSRGLRYIPVLEYLQMAGRAGRPNYDSYGESIIISKTGSEKEKLWDKFILGDPEDIYSKLAVEPVLRTYILSLIASGYVYSEKQIIDFFSKTFWAHQYKDMFKLKEIILKMLGLLEEFDFIRSEEQKENQDTKNETYKKRHQNSTSDFNSAESLLDIAKKDKDKEENFDYKYEATLLGKRVAELYIDPLTAYQMISNLKTAKKQEIKPISLMHMISYTLEMRPLLKVRAREYDDYEKQLLEYEDQLLEKQPEIYDPEHDDFINAFKTALFFKDWSDESDEEYLLEKYTIRPGEIKAKLDTADWLLYASQELTRILKMHELLKEITKLRFRLKHGVKEELIPLLKLQGIGRVRARRLFNNNIKDIKDVKKADILTIIQLLGKKTALSIKEQVGQKIKEIPKGTRKGQTSINKFK